MSRRVVAPAAVAAVVVAALVSAAVAGAAGPAARAATRAPARLLVSAQEFSLLVSRRQLHAGAVMVQLYNRGEDPHDLRARRLDAHGHAVGPAQRLALTSAGALSEATWRLRRGTYRLYCSLPGHAHRGMRATLRVR